eukprot:PhM_4_TR15228/c0_g1_i1/m.48140/K19199/SETD3; histone-lysine N-methyltransferase SETD3
MQTYSVRLSSAPLFVFIPLLFLIVAQANNNNNVVVTPSGSTNNNDKNSADRDLQVKHFQGRQDRIDAFNTWFEQHYTKDRPRETLKVRVAPAGDADMRMGVFATRRIAPEEVYLRIPLDLIISVSTAHASPAVGPVLRQHFAQQPQVALAVYLLHERFVSGASSFWAPYISLLPTSHDTPLFFDDADLALLDGTNFRRKVLDDRWRYRSEYRTVQSTFDSRAAHVFPADVLTLDNYMWAVGILNTRMIWWDGEPHLVPMLDMINCREGTGNPNRVHQTVREHSSAITRAAWGFKRGDEIYENYGQHNPYYFFSHGFVLLPNTHDCALITLPRVTGSKLSLGQRHRLFPDEPCVSPSPQHFNRVVAAFRVATLSSDAKAKEYLTNSRDVVGSRVSVKNEKRALAGLIDACTEQLERYPTTPREDDALLQGSSLTFRQSQSVLFRMTQKKILMDVIKLADARLLALKNGNSKV